MPIDQLGLEGFLFDDSPYNSVRSCIKNNEHQYHCLFINGSQTKFMVYPEDASAYNATDFGEVKGNLAGILGINFDDGEGVFEGQLSTQEIVGFIQNIWRKYSPASMTLAVEHAS